MGIQFILGTLELREIAVMMKLSFMNLTNSEPQEERFLEHTKMVRH
jgi:hypothetical protein